MDIIYWTRSYQFPYINDNFRTVNNEKKFNEKKVLLYVLEVSSYFIATLSLNKNGHNFFDIQTQ